MMRSFPLRLVARPAKRSLPQSLFQASHSFTRYYPLTLLQHFTSGSCRNDADSRAKSPSRNTVRGTNSGALKQAQPIIDSPATELNAHSSGSTSPFSGTVLSSGLSDVSSPFESSGPAPPRLPKEDQEIFERLQREAMKGPNPEQSVHSRSQSSASPLPSSSAQQTQPDTRALHPHVRAAVPPEFEGDTNPKTGEVGGPKNEPLRWGTSGDWSYGGRVTDF